MSTEQTDAPQWGAPPPPAQPRTRWSVKRIAVTVAIAVGIAGAGGVAIHAASGSTSAEQAGPGGRTGGGGPMLVGGPMGSMAGTDHGEFQTGEVTDLTDDSVTAKSDDGYTRTYVIDDGTELGTDVAEGDEVTIIATTEGTTATAESVLEVGAMPQRRDGDGGPPDNAGPGDGGN